MNTPITYRCTLYDEPIMIQSSDLLLLALVLKIEIKKNQMIVNVMLHLHSEDGAYPYQPILHL